MAPFCIEMKNRKAASHFPFFVFAEGRTLVLPFPLDLWQQQGSRNLIPNLAPGLDSRTRQSSADMPLQAGRTNFPSSLQWFKKVSPPEFYGRTHEITIAAVDFVAASASIRAPLPHSGISSEEKLKIPISVIS